MSIKQENIPKLVKSQKLYFSTHVTKDVNFRLNQLKKLKQAIKENESKIVNALFKDLKKSEFESYSTEIGYILHELSYVIKNLKKWVRNENVKNTLLFPFSKSFIVREPYGVTLHISPWNYPFQLALSSVVGAMAAGNTVILKPSEVSPATAEVLDRIISKEFKKEYFAVITGDAKTSQKLLEQDLDYIFYTGNEVVGKIVMQAAAKNLTPVTLELGGKSPCIVDETADLNITAKRIVFGKFLNAGQTCIAPDYILVQNSIKHKFVELLKKEIKTFFSEDPKFSKDYGRIISKKHFERLKEYGKFENIIFGGNLDKNDKYISPTLVDEPRSDSEIMSSEIFGPLLPIITFNKIGETIDFINQRPKPLALYLFTKSKLNEELILTKTSSGGVCINDTVTQVANIHLPFGGVGISGMGRYHGKATYELFSNNKGVLKQPLFFDMKEKYPPYTTKKLKLIKKILK